MPRAFPHLDQRPGLYEQRRAHGLADAGQTDEVLWMTPARNLFRMVLEQCRTMGIVTYVQKDIVGQIQQSKALGTTTALSRALYHLLHTRLRVYCDCPDFLRIWFGSRVWQWHSGVMMGERQRRTRRAFTSNLLWLVTRPDIEVTSPSRFSAEMAGWYVLWAIVVSDCDGRAEPKAGDRFRVPIELSIMPTWTTRILL